MDIYQKFGVDKDISTSDFMQLLDEKKQIVLRKMNNVFDNLEKEAELRNELDEIEATELIVRNGVKDDNVATGLYHDFDQTKNQNKSEGNKNAETYLVSGISCYEEGDMDQAKFFWEKSADLGNTYAMHNLGVLYSNLNDRENELIWYEKAVKAGNNELSIRDLAYYYYKKPAPCASNDRPFLRYLRDRQSIKDNILAYQWFKKYISITNDEYESFKAKNCIMSIFTDYDMYIEEFPNKEYYREIRSEYYRNNYTPIGECSLEMIELLQSLLQFSNKEEEETINSKIEQIIEKTRLLEPYFDKDKIIRPLNPKEKIMFNLSKGLSLIINIVTLWLINQFMVLNNKQTDIKIILMIVASCYIVDFIFSLNIIVKCGELLMYLLVYPFIHMFFAAIAYIISLLIAFVTPLRVYEPFYIMMLIVHFINVSMMNSSYTEKKRTSYKDKVIPLTLD